jgi:hypothetical protein
MTFFASKNPSSKVAKSSVFDSLTPFQSRVSTNIFKNPPSFEIFLYFCIKFENERE